MMGLCSINPIDKGLIRALEMGLMTATAWIDDGKMS